MYQIQVRALDGRTRCLQIPTPQIRVRDLKQTISKAIRIPVHLQRLVTGIKNLDDESLLFAENNKCAYPGVSLLLRLRGGKGGFGSLLRGAATKAGQKKTSNFDACRDMNGRRLRHVNAEKKLEDWRAEAEDRKLETIAQEFLKKKAKELRKTNSKGVDEGARDVAKYRAETSRAMEEVEEAVKDALKGNLKANSKRKGPDSVQSESKKVKLWMLDEEEDDDDEEDEEMEENVNDNDRKEQISDSKDFSINDSVKEESNAGNSGVDSNVLEIEALTVTEECCKDVSSDSSNSDMAASAEVPLVSDKAASVSSAFCNETSIGSCKDGPIDFSTEGESGSSEPSEKECDKQDGAVGRYGEHKPADSQVSVRDMQVNSTEKVETSNSQLAGIHEGTDSVCHSNGNDYSMEALNFDCFNTAKEMEALGLERLKIELQTRGLKCGGSLSERAARLFLLKTTPLNKLPNKLFAKSK